MGIGYALIVVTLIVCLCFFLVRVSDKRAREKAIREYAERKARRLNNMSEEDRKVEMVMLGTILSMGKKE